MTEKKRELLSQIQEDISKLMDTHCTFETNDNKSVINVYKEFTENMVQKLIFDKFHRCDPTLTVVTNFDDVSKILTCSINTDDPVIQDFLRSISTDIQDLDF